MRSGGTRCCRWSSSVKQTIRGIVCSEERLYPRSKALRPECWFARPGLVTVCPYVPSPPLTSGDNPTTKAYAAAIAGSL